MRKNLLQILGVGVVLFFWSCSTHYATDDSSSLVEGGSEFTVAAAPRLPLAATEPEAVQQDEKVDPALTASREEVIVEPPGKTLQKLRERRAEQPAAKEAVEKSSHRQVKQQMRQQRREIVQAYKGYSAAAQPADDDIAFLLLIIIAILLPPLALFLLYGLDTEFWIGLILTILGYLPGIIYALYKIFDYYDDNGGEV